MRIWHVDLIKYLPKDQLIAQWKECCAIARCISIKGTPNHRLVNKVMNYPIDHFIEYTRRVAQELINKGYRCQCHRFEFYDKLNDDSIHVEHPFPQWHNGRYMVQCMFNLQEKYDCYAMNDHEWEVIIDGVRNYFKGL